MWKGIFKLRKKKQKKTRLRWIYESEKKCWKEVFTLIKNISNLNRFLIKKKTSNALPVQRICFDVLESGDKWRQKTSRSNDMLTKIFFQKIANFKLKRRNKICNVYLNKKYEK